MDKVLREYVGVCGSVSGSHSLFDELADGSEGSSNVGGGFGTFVSIDIVVAAGPMSGGSGGDHPMLLLKLHVHPAQDVNRVHTSMRYLQSRVV